MTDQKPRSVEWLAVTTLSIAQLPMTALSVFSVGAALMEGTFSSILTATVSSFLTVCLSVTNAQIVRMRRLGGQAS